MYSYVLPTCPSVRQQQARSSLPQTASGPQSALQPPSVRMCLKLIFVISYHILGTSIVITNADTNMTGTDVPTEPWDMYSNMSSSYASLNSTSSLGLVPEDPRGGEGVVNIFRIGYFYPLRWIESLFGWFGNCLVIVAVTRYPDLQTPTGSLLANLALADVLTASLTPLSTAVEAMGRSSQWLYCCIIKEILYTIASFGNILSLTLISIDRLICITAPFWYNKHVTLGLTLVGQAIGWVVIFTTYIVIFTARSNINHPIPTCVYPFLISESDMKLFLLNPFYFLNSVTILNYVILVAVVWKQGRKIAPHVANATHQLQRRQRKLTMTTGIIVGGYLFLTIPLTIMSFEVGK